jgi:hypothetical protein
MVGKPTVARVAPMAPFTEVFMKSLLFGFLFSSMANRTDAYANHWKG